MKTDDLIARLAAEAPQPPFSPRYIVVMTLGCILVVSMAFLLFAGMRAGVVAALGHPLVMAKTLLPAFTCAIALHLALQLARAGGRAEARLGWLLLPAGAALGLWFYAFASQPAHLRFADVGAFALSECIGLIMLLSVGPAAMVTVLLRRGATTTPRLTALIAGLAASSGAATGYSLFCVQDNPLFYVTWYGVAILLSALLTAGIGARALRW